MKRTAKIRCTFNGMINGDLSRDGIGVKCDNHVWENEMRRGHRPRLIPRPALVAGDAILIAWRYPITTNSVTRNDVALYKTDMFSVVPLHRVLSLVWVRHINIVGLTKKEALHCYCYFVWYLLLFCMIFSKLLLPLKIKFLSRYLTDTFSWIDMLIGR